jgi:cyanate lyase
MQEAKVEHVSTRTHKDVVDSSLLEDVLEQLTSDAVFQVVAVLDQLQLVADQLRLVADLPQLVEMAVVLLLVEMAVVTSEVSQPPSLPMDTLTEEETPKYSTL